MLVRFDEVAGEFSAELDIEAIPRIGDGVQFEPDGTEFSVRHVIWDFTDGQTEAYITIAQQ